jgi:hypothetical protein
VACRAERHAGRDGLVPGAHVVRGEQAQAGQGRQMALAEPGDRPVVRTLTGWRDCGTSRRRCACARRHHPHGRVGVRARTKGLRHRQQPHPTVPPALDVACGLAIVVFATFMARRPPHSRTDSGSAQPSSQRGAANRPWGRPSISSTAVADQYRRLLTGLATPCSPARRRSGLEQRRLAAPDRCRTPASSGTSTWPAPRRSWRRR